MRRVLVCGGRDYSDVATLNRALSEEHAKDPFDVLIHGGAAGADRLAGIWAKAMKVHCCVYVADWRNHGPSAGPRRNARMLVEGQPDVVIAFPGGRGTDDMVGRARVLGVPIISVGFFIAGETTNAESRDRKTEE